MDRRPDIKQDMWRAACTCDAQYRENPVLIHWTARMYRACVEQTRQVQCCVSTRLAVTLRHKHRRCSRYKAAS